MKREVRTPNQASLFDRDLEINIDNLPYINTVFSRLPRLAPPFEQPSHVSCFEKKHSFSSISDCSVRERVKRLIVGFGFVTPVITVVIVPIVAINLIRAPIAE